MKKLIVHSDAKMIASDYTTRTEALNSGSEIVDKLSTISRNELNEALTVFSHDTLHHLSVKILTFKSRNLQSTAMKSNYC